MVRDAEAHADDDKARRERVTVSNDLDSLIYQTEKIIKDNQSAFSADDVKAANDAIAEGRDLNAKKDSSIEQLRSTFEKLQSISHKLATELYNKNKTAGAAPGADAGAEAGGEAKSGEDVIDADYKDVR
jgi:molecular chaperone DnaK